MSKIISYELIDDPICDVDDWDWCYADCTECHCFYDCMDVIEEEE